MTKQELVQALETSSVWTADRYGNFKLQTPNNIYRIKVQANSIRLEVQVTYDATQYSPASKGWVKVSGAYFKDLELVNNKEGKPALKVGKSLLKLN